MRTALLVILFSLCTTTISAQLIAVPMDPPDGHIWVVKRAPTPSGKVAWVVFAEEEPTWWERNGDDVVNVVTSNRPSLNRTIGSGSIVRDDNINPATVEYFEEIAWGLQFESRSTNARLARDGARNLSVPDQAVVVIESGLVPNVPQEWAYHQGETVVRKDSVTDAIIDRVPSSGAFD